MHAKIFFAFMTTFIPFCLAGEEPQEIRVHLLQESPLSLLSISPIDCSDGSFSPEYLKELDCILQYDFNHNAKTTTSLNNPKAPYSLSFSLQNKKIQVKAFHKKEAQGKSFQDIVLTGSLSQDRKTLHQLSDAIHKFFFQSEGIASSKILYAKQAKTTEGSWISEIAECDWDGGNVKLLTHENSYCVTPVVVPKSENFQKDLFLYVSYKTGQPRIFIASKDEGKGKKVVDIRGNQILPAITKQRDKIAFICDASGRTDLFIQDINPETGLTKTPIQLYSYPRSTQASPVFSPDGSKIAFVSDKDGSPRIYLIPSVTKGKRATAEMLTKKNKENSCPSWSPDGTKLAYSTKTNGIRQIWIYDFLLKEEKQITCGPGNKENPCWAPNSLHIVFNSTDGAGSDLYVVNLNQPNAIKITKGQGKNHYPSWGLR